MHFHLNDWTVAKKNWVLKSSGTSYNQVDLFRKAPDLPILSFEEWLSKSEKAYLSSFYEDFA